MSDSQYHHPGGGRFDLLGRCASALAALLVFALAPASAAEPPREQVEFFEKKVRPLLADNCFKCHSQTGKKKGDLLLDSRVGLLTGGTSGPALVPGQPDKSRLIKAIGYQDTDLHMPPSKKLPDEAIAVLTRWVELGAPWPGGSASTVLRPGVITEEDRRFWSFQPLRLSPVPIVNDVGWSLTWIDRFVFQRLQSEGLKPSPPAERAALIRRVYFDLIGLPPTPAEVDAFVADRSPGAYETLIDRLLASPRYGERWARHWLDLVRYAESDGYRADAYRPNAWRYRDYVIRAFNDDKPYDRFVCEQLAGDELAPNDPDALIATGYLRHWIYEWNQRDVRTQWNTILDDVTEVTGDVFLGLGMGCARCHDHKFDPILQKDYYRLQAFFAPILPHDEHPLATAQQRAEYQAKLTRWEERTADLRRQIEALEGSARDKAGRGAVQKFPPDIQGMMGKPPGERTPLEHQLAELAYRQVQYEFDHLDAKFKGDAKQKLADLRKQLAAFDAEKPEPLPVALAVRDVGPNAPPTVIPKRTTQGAIEPGFLTLLDEKPAVIERIPTAPQSTGRRTALARWMTRPDNALTTRVIVNRIWQYHFGRGLVGTTSDFGRLGETPSHPELLDWLANRFIQDGWSFKRMHRLILTSATYRQSATHPAPAAAVRKDPENRLWWRMNTRRLEAEQIRDAILAVTGELDPARYGPGVDLTRPCRTIYTKALRNTRDPLLNVFDLPEGFGSIPQRNVTTTPTQALLLINGPYMLQRARALADRLQREHGDREAEWIDAAFRLTFGRLPAPQERDAMTAFLKRQAKPNKTALADLCHVLLTANEFLYVD
jgi:hypothetical protein